MNESSALLSSLRRVAAASGPIHVETSPADAWLAAGAARARLHEVYVAHADDAASGAGFAVALALAARAMPMLWVRTEDGERQGGRLHATGAVELGLDADQLLLAVVADEAALLRTAAEAARCPGLGTLLIEAWGRAPGIDLTATRRLMLAAEASGVTVLNLRLCAEPSPSAAATRWGVAPAPSSALEANAPGRPVFDVEMLRRRGGTAGARWRVEWNREDQQFYDLEARARPLSGPRLPVAPDRTSAQRPPASVRRTG